MTAPLVEAAASKTPTCANCGVVLDGWPSNTVCPECGSDNTQGGPAVGESSVGGIGPGLENGALAQEVTRLTGLVERLMDRLPTIAAPPPTPTDEPSEGET
jgi:hypothetical protein